MVRRQEERRVKVAGTHVIADGNFRPSGISGVERDLSPVTSPRCPTVETFRLLSHGYQPLSHAFPLVFLPSPSHLFTVKRHFDPSHKFLGKFVVIASSISTIEQ